jgi:ABC-type multidrug transport system permease subunit
MKSFYKVLAWIFATLCVISALLQYNDPDPIIWMLIYGVAAAVSIGFALDKIKPYLPLIVGILGIFGFIYVFPNHFEGFDFAKGMSSANVEEGREAFGLLIISMFMFLFAIRMKFGINRSE